MPNTLPKSFKSLLVLVCALLLALLPSPSARAEQADPFSVDPWVSVPLITGSFLIAGSMDLIVKPLLPGAHCGLSCDASLINGLDHGVTTNHNPTAKTASDILVVGTMLTPALLGVIDAGLHNADRGWANYGEDLLIVGETLAITYLLNDIVKFAVRRPRPLVYNTSGAFSDEEKQDPDAALSFYSLHSSFTFAAATSFSYLFNQRHPGDYKWTLPVWIGTHVLAATTAYLRVEAGKHFWSDILIGAAVGSCIGILVPYLHQDGDNKTQSDASIQSLQVGLGSLAFTW